jgi:hypothetical protein
MAKRTEKRLVTAALIVSLHAVVATAVVVAPRTRFANLLVDHPPVL